jgi:hypothetical protein
MNLNRSHLVLVAGVGFALLASFEWMRGEPADPGGAAPAAPPPVAAAPEVQPATAAAPAMALAPSEPDPAFDEDVPPEVGARIFGRLRDDRGAPVVGETVELFSNLSGRRNRAVSDAAGHFELPGVGPHPGYYLQVRPRAGYRDYRSSLDVGEDGASVDITLERLSTTRLTGRLVDSDGRPIPYLDFSIASGQALAQAIPARSDADGSFSVESIPTGHLSLLANAPERIVIGGILLSPGADAYLTIRADWGPEQLSGRVVDAGSEPLAGAEVELSWAHVDPDATGRSSRSFTTDGTGAFRFQRLASGVHRLAVRAPGYRPLEVDYEVGPDTGGVEVALTPAGGAG